MKNRISARRSYTPRTAHNGRSQWFSACAGSLLRIHHAKHAAKHHLGAAATTSTIVRRALAIYSEMVDHLIELPADDPAVTREGAALQRANRGDFTTLPDDLLLITPVRALLDLIKSHHDSKPKAIDKIRADLKLWAALDEGNENEH